MTYGRFYLHRGKEMDRFIASGEMAFAYFKAHASGGFWPIVNKGELAVIYCFMFLFIAFKESGALSLDSLRKKQVNQ
jgi:putative oxidoreductase